MSFEQWFKPALVLCVLLLPAQALMAQGQACFSPPLPGGCDPLLEVVQAIDGAQKTVLIQMYALTNHERVGERKARGLSE